MRQMLFEAAYWRGDPRPGIDEGLATPELSKLLEGWGRNGDTAVIAEESSISIGAAWYRFWNESNHSYGYISEQIPELAIGVCGDFRGQGVGHQLIRRLLHEAFVQGHQHISLSVERDNPALKLYEATGFKIVESLGNAYTMIAHNTAPNQSLNPDPTASR